MDPTFEYVKMRMVSWCAKRRTEHNETVDDQKKERET
jgi:hypothetical protein